MSVVDGPNLLVIVTDAMMHMHKQCEKEAAGAVDDLHKLEEDLLADRLHIAEQLTADLQQHSDTSYITPTCTAMLEAYGAKLEREFERLNGLLLERATIAATTARGMDWYDFYNVCCFPLIMEAHKKIEAAFETAIQDQFYVMANKCAAGKLAAGGNASPASGDSIKPATAPDEDRSRAPRQPNTASRTAAGKHSI